MMYLKIRHYAADYYVLKYKRRWWHLYWTMKTVQVYDGIGVERRPRLWEYNKAVTYADQITERDFLAELNHGQEEFKAAKQRYKDTVKQRKALEQQRGVKVVW